MAVRTELCQFPTADGGTLHGLLFSPEDATGRADLVALTVHGVSGSFYRGFLPRLAQDLAGHGQPVMTMNTRGHDWVAPGIGAQLWGAAHEKLEDSLLDLDGALAFLAGRGFRRFVLIGHSLGGVKVVYYQGTRQRADIAGVATFSAPKIYYPARGEREPDTFRLLAEAEAMIEAERGDDYLKDTARVGIFTPGTYINKYGNHGRSDVRPHAGRLGCPLLSTAGSLETPDFAEHAREMAAAAGAGQGAAHVVEGADHYYTGHLDDLLGLTEPWLERVASSAVGSGGR